MPYTLSIQPELRIAHFIFFGTVTLAEGRAAFVAYTSHPKFQADMIMDSDSWS